MCSFPQFSLTCFDILSWNFADDLVLMYCRSPLSVVILRQFLKELCLFLNLEYRKCLSFYTPVFRRDVLCYGDVRPGLRPSVWLSVRPTLRSSNSLSHSSDSPSVWVSVRPFSALFSYMLWHIELKFCTWLWFNVPQIKFQCRHFASIFERVMSLCELRI